MKMFATERSLLTNILFGLLLNESSYEAQSTVDSKGDIVVWVGCLWEAALDMRNSYNRKMEQRQSP